MTDSVDAIVTMILDNSDEEAGCRLLDAIDNVRPCNNSTILLFCAQLVAHSLAAFGEDKRDECWAAFGRLMLLSLHSATCDDGGGQQ